LNLSENGWFTCQYGVFTWLRLSIMIYWLSCARLPTSKHVLLASTMRFRWSFVACFPSNFNLSYWYLLSYRLFSCRWSDPACHMVQFFWYLSSQGCLLSVCDCHTWSECCRNSATIRWQSRMFLILIKPAIKILNTNVARYIGSFGTPRHLFTKLQDFKYVEGLMVWK
jgi:hypothetical protein